jgi:hypothetical protein
METSDVFSWKSGNFCAFLIKKILYTLSCLIFFGDYHAKLFAKKDIVWLGCFQIPEMNLWTRMEIHPQKVQGMSMQI